MARIRDIAKACKSKNAGPFEVTIDVVFDEHSMYERVRATGVLGPELFARLYHVRPEDVLFSEYPAGNAFKATINLSRFWALSTYTGTFQGVDINYTRRFDAFWSKR